MATTDNRPGAETVSAPACIRVPRSAGAAG
jgi:hypothetical protein